MLAHPCSSHTVTPLLWVLLRWVHAKLLVRSPPLHHVPQPSLIWPDKVHMLQATVLEAVLPLWADPKLAKLPRLHVIVVRILTQVRHEPHVSVCLPSLMMLHLIIWQYIMHSFGICLSSSSGKVSRQVANLGAPLQQQTGPHSRTSWCHTSAAGMRKHTHGLAWQHRTCCRVSP